MRSSLENVYSGDKSQREKAFGVGWVGERGRRKAPRTVKGKGKAQLVNQGDRTALWEL